MELGKIVACLSYKVEIDEEKNKTRQGVDATITIVTSVSHADTER